jgi:type I restriction enzyme S subunit
LRCAKERESSCDWIPISELIRGRPNNEIFRKNNEYEVTGQAGLPVAWVEQLFQGNEINTRDCRRLIASKEEIAKYGLANGDILFCRSSLKPGDIAKANIYLGADNQALFECHLIRVSPDRSKINPIFLNECLNLPEVRNEARRLSKTSTMTTIDQEGILAIKVPLPPLHVQERFATERVLFDEISSRRYKSVETIEAVVASLSSETLGK